MSLYKLKCILKLSNLQCILLYYLFGNKIMAIENQLIEKTPATINTVTRVGGNILNSIIILNYLSFSTIITMRTIG